MTAQHIQEPWIVAEESFDNGGIQESVIRGLDGRAAIAVTLDFGPNNPGMRDANARRIVACVNACAGIPTPSLEGEVGVVESVTKFTSNKLAEARKQRDELLAAAENYAMHYLQDEAAERELCVSDEQHEAAKELFVAIAKAKEGAL